MPMGYPSWPMAHTYVMGPGSIPNHKADPHVLGRRPITTQTPNYQADHAESIAKADSEQHQEVFTCFHQVIRICNNCTWLNQGATPNGLAQWPGGPLSQACRARPNGPSQLHGA